MRWMRREESGPEAELAEQARHQLAALRGQIAGHLEQGEWDAADSALAKSTQLMKESSHLAPVTQSHLAEMHGQWGLLLTAERRYEEAFKHLALSEQIMTMEHPSAVAWAASEGITVEGEGELPDLRLVLDVLTTLADASIRQGQSAIGPTLAQIVQVADVVGDEGEQWEARSRLATFTAGLADWPRLLEIAQEMGAYAQRTRSLAQMMEALRQLAEAHIGLQQLSQALEAQALVVDIARFLGHPALAEEQRELQKLLGGAIR